MSRGTVCLPVASFGTKEGAVNVAGQHRDRVNAHQNCFEIVANPVLGNAMCKHALGVAVARMVPVIAEHDHAARMHKIQQRSETAANVLGNTYHSIQRRCFCVPMPDRQLSVGQVATLVVRTLSGLCLVLRDDMHGRRVSRSTGNGTAGATVIQRTRARLIRPGLFSFIRRSWFARIRARRHAGQIRRRGAAGADAVLMCRAFGHRAFRHLHCLGGDGVRRGSRRRHRHACAGGFRRDPCRGAHHG